MQTKTVNQKSIYSLPQSPPLSAWRLSEEESYRLRSLLENVSQFHPNVGHITQMGGHHKTRSIQADTNDLKEVIRECEDWLLAFDRYGDWLANDQARRRRTLGVKFNQDANRRSLKRPC